MLKTQETIFRIFDDPVKHLLVKHNLVWVLTKGKLTVLPFSSFKESVTRETSIEEIRHCIEVRLKCLNETNAILSADNLIFKVSLLDDEIKVEKLVELENELDPILFINKMRYLGRQILFLTTMLGSLIVFDLSSRTLVCQ